MFSCILDDFLSFLSLSPMAGKIVAGAKLELLSVLVQTKRTVSLNMISVV